MYKTKKSVLEVEVSCFANYDTPANPQPIKLLKWLTSTKYVATVERIRSIKNKAERDKLKATLPAITPSGLFTYRAAKNLIEHSGLLQFDIDLKQNEGIGNYAALKAELSKCVNVAYCGRSVSGLGFWGLVPISEPSRHAEHFAQLEAWFKSKGITLDTLPKSVASLRGYSFDPEAYFNHEAEPLRLPPKQAAPQRHATARPYVPIDSNEVFTRAQEYATQKAGGFAEGSRHNFIFHLCCYLNYKGISRPDAESWIHSNLTSDIKSNCISYPYQHYQPGNPASLSAEPIRYTPPQTKATTPPPNQAEALRTYFEHTAVPYSVDLGAGYFAEPAPDFVKECFALIDAHDVDADAALEGLEALREILTSKTL